MRMNWLIYGCLAGALAVAFATVVVALSDVSERAAIQDEMLSCSSQEGGQVSVKTNRVVTKVRTETGLEHLNSLTLEKKVSSTAKTDEKLPDDKLMEKVIDELIHVLDAAMSKRDFKTVLALAERLRDLNYGMLANGRGVRSVGSAKIKLLSALLQEGSAAGVGFALDLLQDPEPVVAQTAELLLFKSLKDLSLGDYNRAEIVVGAAEKLTDTLTLNKLFGEFIKMRHSVGVGAIKEIAASGTDNAKQIIAQRVVGAFTSNVLIDSIDQLDVWLEENPDKPEDDFFYGPIIIKNTK